MKYLEGAPVSGDLGWGSIGLVCENSIKEAVQSVGCGSQEMWITNCGPVIDRYQVGRYRT